MPALPPSEFVAQAQAKGFVFSVKPDGSLGVRPPARGAMTESMRRYLSTMKAELLALLTEAGSAPIVSPEEGRKSPKRPDAEGQKRSEKVGFEGQEKARKGVMQEAGKEPQKAAKSHTQAEIFPALYAEKDERQALLDWAVSEARRGALPEPVEPLQLFNGDNTGVSLSAWLLSAHARALALLSEPEGAAGRAFLHLRQSMKGAALWAADWVRYEQATITHVGACSSLGQPAEESTGP